MSKTYITTRTHKLGRVESVRIANLALRWCRKTLGTNKRKRLAPVWSVLSADETETAMGEYDAEDNHIYIYWRNCDSVADLVTTCIHEWTHQLQPILTKYKKYEDDYANNPYEVEARYNETLYGTRCWAAIKTKVNRYDSNTKAKRS